MDITRQQAEAYRTASNVGSLPGPVSAEEAEAKASECFAVLMNDERFTRPLGQYGIPTHLAASVHKIGFMEGGAAATERVQQYVDAGGVLEKSELTAAQPCFSIARLLAFCEQGCEWYAGKAPTVAEHLDELYRRLNGDPKSVTAYEMGRLMQLIEGTWAPANYAANLVYKLRTELGMDTTGHAGF